MESVQAYTLKSKPRPSANISVIRIQPARGWISLELPELWGYRELLYFLVWRDLKVRYKQTMLGAAWAIIQPVSAMLVFTLFFGRMAKIPSTVSRTPFSASQAWCRGVCSRAA